MSGLAACTVASRNHLHRVRVLERSLHQHHPEVPLYVLVVDLDSSRVALSGGTRTIVLGQHDLLAADEVDWLSGVYKPIEYCGHTKPVLMEHVLALGHEKVFHLDSDLAILGSLAPLERALDDASILITPHLLDPDLTEGYPADELKILRAGTYNSGFVGVANSDEGRRFTAWWRKRLRTHGFADMKMGMFADQRWLDLVPGLFAGTKIVRHPGANVAYWNLYDRVLGEDGDRWLVDGHDLLFFHFSGYDYNDPTNLSGYVRGRTVSDPQLAKLLVQYGEALRQADRDRVSALPYGFSTFTNGVRFPPFCRKILRDYPDLKERFPRPRVADGPDPLFAWLCEPVWPCGDGLMLSRYVHALYHSDKDLQAQFPDAAGRDLERWMEWLAANERLAPAVFTRLCRRSADQMKALVHA